MLTADSAPNTGTVTITLGAEEARQLKAVLSIVARKGAKSPFWSTFSGTVASIIARLG